MKIISTKTLLQTTAVLLTSLVLLGCPIDDDDIFTGDVTITNNTGVDFIFVSIETAGSAAGAGGNLGGILNTESSTFSGYDCATIYQSTAQQNGGLMVIGTETFTPSCGGGVTVIWTVAP